jgi:hypothetical protein
MTRANDIKAPDGYLLGGLRRVRGDGTILFQRGWWKAPEEWIGKEVWVHEDELGSPGMRDRAERPDAKQGWRDPVKLAWANRHNDPPLPQPDPADIL